MGFCFVYYYYYYYKVTDDTVVTFGWGFALFHGGFAGLFLHLFCF